MYNEKTRPPFMAPRGNVPCAGTAVKRDIPTLDFSGGMQSRRRCDGSLRNSVDEQMHGHDHGNQACEMHDRRRGDGSPRYSNDGEMPMSDCARGNCGGWGLTAKPLAMIYSPCQAWRDAYAPDVALSRGTLFRELDLPFEPAKNRKGCM